MASPYQGSGGVQPHLPSHQSAYPGSQGLVMGSNPAMVPVGVPESQGGMETSGSMNPGGPQQPQPPRDFNMALLCRIGQETVQEIVGKTTELFQTLKVLQVYKSITTPSFFNVLLQNVKISTCTTQN